MKPTSKITIISYIFTYYAIASAFPLSLANYFLVGWQINVDQFYWPSWKNFLGILVVFNVLVSTEIQALAIINASHHFQVCHCILSDPPPASHQEILPRPPRDDKVDTSIHPLLRGYLKTSQQSHPLSLSRNQHGVDIHRQGARSHWLLYWHG